MIVSALAFRFFYEQNEIQTQADENKKNGWRQTYETFDSELTMSGSGGPGIEDELDAHRERIQGDLSIARDMALDELQNIYIGGSMGRVGGAVGGVIFRNQFPGFGGMGSELVEDVTQTLVEALFDITPKPKPRQRVGMIW